MDPVKECAMTKQRRDFKKECCSDITITDWRIRAYFNDYA